MERPWVPSTRSFSRGWMAMSSTGTVGRFSLSRFQRAALVERDVEAALGAREQQLRVAVVLADHVDHAVVVRDAVVIGFQVSP